MRLAYLVSQYPASSHTFIRREIDSLRKLGAAIETFSIRQPLASEVLAREDKAAAENTWFLLPISLPRLFITHAFFFMNRPKSYLSTLKLASCHRAPGMRAMFWSLFHFAESVILAKELKLRKIDHVHIHFANAGATVGFLASHFLKLPWSLTLHGISETDYPAGLTLGAKVSAAQFVSCVSWFGQAQAMRLSSPKDWSKFEIVRCGLDLSDDRLAMKGATDQSSRVRAVCVARLSPEKGHIGLLNALHQARELGKDLHLTLIGDGPLRDTLEREVISLGLSEHVTFAGRLDESSTLAGIRDSDILILPSFMEGLPIVLMEAMAIGTPVIASRVAGIPELVEERLGGLLFTPGDWSDLCAKIIEMCHADHNRALMTQRARLKIEEEFDSRRSVLPLLLHFRESECNALPT